MPPTNTLTRLSDAPLCVGDLLVWCAYHIDGKPVSPLAVSIAKIGEGWAYHVSVVARDQGEWVAIEMLPQGCSLNSIAKEVSEYPDSIHHFAVPNAIAIDRLSGPETHIYQRDIAVSKAREFDGTKYGFNQIFRDLVRQTSILRWLVTMPTDDAEEAKRALVCSGLAAIAVNAGFDWDVFPNFSDSAAEPSDFTRSPIFEDRGILTP